MSGPKKDEIAKKHADLWQYDPDIGRRGDCSGPLRLRGY